MRPLFFAVMLVMGTAVAAPNPGLSAAQAEQVEALRKEIGNQLQLQAYDLVDELVYGWTKEPPFAADTPVVLADVSVPVGFGSTLQALVENHFLSVLSKNAGAHVKLSLCHECTATVVHSGKSGTVISRGVDDPAALSKSGGLARAQRALFLDFEVEGSALVLRVRITALEPSLPIVWAKTLTTAGGPAALLRSPEHLKSASEARTEYLDALQARGIALVPVRLSLRSYAPGGGATTMQTAPFIWLTSGAEIAFTQARAWTGSLTGGITYFPDQHVGFMVQGRLSRLLSGSASSLTHPDLYGFLSASVLNIHGQSALTFSDEVPTVENLRQAIQGTGKPSTTFATFGLGLELRIKNRIGVGAFLESAPALNNAPSIGRYLDFGVVQFHSFGAEVSVWF